jgi:hypothetical protein
MLVFSLSDLLDSVEDTRPTTADTNLYVAVGGSDSNPGTLALPFATPQAAVSSLTKELQHLATINIGPGDFPGFIVQGFNIRPLGTAPAGLLIAATISAFTPTTGTGTGTSTSTVTGSLSPPVFTVLNDNTQTWTVDEFKDLLLEYTTAQGVLVHFPIVSNTSTSITIASAASIPSVGAYAIRTQGTRINATTLIPAAIGSTATRTVGVLIANNRSAKDYCGIQLDGLKIDLGSPTAGLSLQQPSGVLVTRCHIALSGTGSNIAADGPGNFTVTKTVLKGTGASVLAALGVNLSNSLAVSFTTSIMRGTATGNGFISDGQSQLSVSQVLIDSPAFAFKLQSPGYTVVNGTKISGCSGQALRLKATNATTGAHFLAVNSGLDISNCGTGIEIDGASSAVFTGSVTGTGNTTGITLSAGARLRISAGSTLTGATEVSLDGAATTLAAMRAASPKLLSTTYGTIIHE